MLLTRKSSNGAARRSRLAAGLPAVATMDRRTFLKRSGAGAGIGALASQLPFSMIGEARAQGADGGKVEVKRTVCTHCSVGCAIDAVVKDGVWMRQEPVFDSPFNLGSHCAKGASIREHGIAHDSHRLKYPMKLQGGKWQRVSWERVGSGRDLLDRLVQAQQRAVLPAVQVRAPLRHEQHRPPGAHLPLHDRSRHREYVGLRGDD
jgi:formate dehydrogenase major subunit